MVTHEWRSKMDARKASELLHAYLGRRPEPPPEHEWTKFVAQFRLRRLERSAYLVHAGGRTRDVAFVCTGLLRIFYTRRDGREFNKAFVRPPDFVAALESLLTDEPSRLSIQCLEPSVLYVADYSVLRSFYDQSMYWQRFGRLFVEALYVKKARREAALLMDSASDRYARFRHEHADIEGRLADYHVASYLGITPEALSRLKKKTAR
jgi:CRP-like cAMP-binding protein